MSTTVVDEEFRRRLRLIMQQFGSVADLARAVGVSDNAIYKWVSGRGQPSMVSLVNLARAVGVSVEWLATGRGVAAKSKTETHTLDSSDYVTMPRHDLRGVGSHNSIQNQQIVDSINFRSDWIQRSFNVDPRSLALIEVLGDSMSPTVDEGDLVLVDVHENRFKSDGLYVLRSGGDLAVKRLQQRPDGSLMIRSDNAAYEPQLVAQDDIAILGRVVWAGGRL